MNGCSPSCAEAIEGVSKAAQSALMMTALDLNFKLIETPHEDRIIARAMLW
jgi:hypothetical protein